MYKNPQIKNRTLMPSWTKIGIVSSPENPAIGVIVTKVGGVVSGFSYVGI